jgi:transposase
MPKAYSADMRGRVIAEVEGGASRREAAEEFQVSASTAIIWVKCFRETGRCAAKPRGGSVSPLDKHADFLLGLIEKAAHLVFVDETAANTKMVRLSGRCRRGLPVRMTAGKSSIPTDYVVKSAALANAVFDATGVRLRTVPFTQENIDAAWGKSS